VKVAATVPQRVVGAAKVLCSFIEPSKFFRQAFDIFNTQHLESLGLAKSLLAKDAQIVGAHLADSLLWLVA
jgi:hypothetical protein